MNPTTKSQVHNLPVISMTVEGALLYGTDVDETNDTDQQAIQQFLDNISPEQLHRFHSFILDHTADESEELGTAMYDVAETFSKNLLLCAQGQLDLPTLTPDYDCTFINQIRVHRPIESSTIAQLLDTVDSELQQQASQALQCLEKLPATRQANTDLILHRIITRYRDALVHHQQVMTLELIDIFAGPAPSPQAQSSRSIQMNTIAY